MSKKEEIVNEIIKECLVFKDNETYMAYRYEKIINKIIDILKNYVSNPQLTNKRFVTIASQYPNYNIKNLYNKVYSR